MRITESRLRNIIRNVIRESHEAINKVSDWQDVWDELEWDNYNIDYSDGKWDEVKSLLDSLRYLSPDTYGNETEFHHDYETYRNEFETAAMNWFLSGSGSDERLEALNDFVTSSQYRL